MCRRFGIERWPYRKIQSLKHLKKCVSDSSFPTIEKEIERIKKDPNSDVADSIKSIINITYKQPHKKIDLIEELNEECWRQCLNILLQDPPITDDKPIEQPETPTQAKECWLTSKFVQNNPHVVVGIPDPTAATAAKHV